MATSSCHTVNSNVPKKRILINHDDIQLLREFCAAGNEHDPILRDLLEQSNGNVDAAAAKWFEMKSPLKKKMKLTHDDRDGSTSENAVDGTSAVKNDKRIKLTGRRSEEKEDCEGMQFPIFIGDVLIPVLATVKSNPNTIIRLNDLMEFKRDAKKPLLSKTKAVGKSSANGSKKSGFSSSSSPGGSKNQNTNTIVRVVLIEANGLRREVGKVTSDQGFASNISKLIDNNLAVFTATVVEVPSKLETFTKFHISVRVLLTRHAFQNTKPSESEEDEIRVKDRKTALMWAFTSIGLVPADTQLANTTNPETDAADSSTVKDEDLTREVNVNDLHNIYRQAQKLDRPQTEREPAPGFRVDLRQYQKEALAIMMEMESDGEKSTGANGEPILSPLWRRFVFPNTEKVFFINPYTGELSLKCVPMEKCRGGILADEQGLGKTIETLALIYSNQKPALPSNSITTLGTYAKVKDSNSTLIVCPLSVLAQWREEALRCFRADSSTPASSMVEVYYGGTRSLNDNRRFRGDNGAPIVITTYGVVAAECENENSPLFSNVWYRIVLDEAHYIKERNTKQAKACRALQAERRWCLTGTPIQNKLEDLFSLVHFLRLPPWEQFSFWRSFITIPFERKDVRALEVVTTILQPILLRRTKDMKDRDGNPIVALPVKNVEEVYLEFTKDERIIYDSLLRDSRRRLADEKGRFAYAHVFEMLLRLRQMCDHPFLVAAFAKTTLETIGMEDLVNQYCQGDGASAEYIDSVMKTLQEANSSDSECAICLDSIVAATIVPSCGHTSCRDCLMDFLERCEAQGKPTECPVCRNPCSEKDLLSVMRRPSKGGKGLGSSFRKEKIISGSNSEEIDAEESASNDTDNDGNNSPVPGGPTRPETKITFGKGIPFRLSTKMKALVNFLRNTREASPSTKTVVFSLFTSMLDLIEGILDEQGLGWCRIDGKVTQKKREEVLLQFKSQQSCSVMLASLRSMGVGVNLTCASQVVLVDPWWNRAAEDQAMDRVHRFGQTKNVEVRRLIVKGTVEEKILAIQARKSNIAGAVTSPEDMRMTLEDLKTLFD
ncbi:hypothetical protein SeMB42_g01602 [Synchytrium endobioticum]|uniref:RING-type domain-containing protein n=1 Tax=Synchytrium endobioticum TaxID=286115 RepID=A0A507DH21_9FUNG|nr:hypothetical protein SeLEV6574_g00580 [Synchytrium endobioticum]TPX52196.1 hypothetical protein SeMB42_g01602 [Synchytrium endobioticum]